MGKILIGKIVNTFGIKGELKVASDFDCQDKVFAQNKEIIINNETYVITAIRYHKNHHLIKINELNDINLVLKYKGMSVYTLKENIELNDDEYLMNDLINLDVYEGEVFIGKVTEIINNRANPLIRVNNEFYVPLKSIFIKKIDIKNQKIISENIKELMS